MISMISELILLNSVFLLILVIIPVFLFRDKSIKKKFQILRIISSYTIISFLSNVYFLGTATSTIFPVNIQIIGFSLFISILSIILLWFLIYKYWSD